MNIYDDYITKGAALEALDVVQVHSASGRIFDEIANRIEAIPSVETKQVKYFDEDEKVWKIGNIINQ